MSELTHIFGVIPKQIAKFLKLENPKSYTGNTFRRSSATLLSNAGADITSLNRHGGWKSSSVAESHIQESAEEKLKTARKVFGAKTPTLEDAANVREEDTVKVQNKEQCNN